jgi:hypothetical protein
MAIEVLPVPVASVNRMRFWPEVIASSTRFTAISW